MSDCDSLRAGKKEDDEWPPSSWLPLVKASEWNRVEKIAQGERSSLEGSALWSLPALVQIPPSLPPSLSLSLSLSLELQ